MSSRSGAIWLLVLASFLISPPLAYAGVVGFKEAGLDPLWWWNVVMSFLWLAVLHAHFRRPFWLHVVLAPLYLTATTDLFLVFRYRARLTSSYLSIVITDFSDADGFIRTFWSDMLLSLALLLGIYVFGVKGIRSVEIRCPAKLRWIGLALLLLSYSAVVGRQMRVHGTEFSRAWLDVATHDYNSPVGVIPQIAVTLSLMSQTDRYVVARRSFSFGARRVAREGDEIYVVVIGESSRPDHWSLNEYRRDTSPRLRRMQNLFSLEDMITEAPSTQIAVPSMLSLASVADWPSVQSQRSIVSAFREVGFQTYWLSAQEVSHWGGIIHNIAEEAAVRRYFERKLDDVLVGDVRRILANPARPRKLLLVLHTKGSHFEYSKRYPEEFRIFPDAGGSAVEDLVNAYDNSILYTDYVLAELIELVKSCDAQALVLYSSDHGENLLDDDDKLLGHAIGNKYDLAAAAFIWYSDALAAKFPQKIRAARSRASWALSLSNLPHSILDIAGIEAKGLDRSKSIFSDSFRETPRIYVAKGQAHEYAQGRRPAGPATRQ